MASQKSYKNKEISFFERYKINVPDSYPFKDLRMFHNKIKQNKLSTILIINGNQRIRYTKI